MAKMNYENANRYERANKRNPKRGTARVITIDTEIQKYKELVKAAQEAGNTTEYDAALAELERLQELKAKGVK